MYGAILQHWYHLSAGFIFNILHGKIESNEFTVQSNLTQIGKQEIRDI
jgi:hypothetical protein